MKILKLDKCQNAQTHKREVENKFMSVCPWHTFLYNSQNCFVQVFAYITVAAIASYTKLSIAVQLHHDHDKDVALFLAGAITQIGSFVGSILFFALVFFTNIYRFWLIFYCIIYYNFLKHNGV